MNDLGKKLLIIAYHFPPDVAVGALRPQKFVKYLPEFGWSPHVLTIGENYLENADPSRLADITTADIHRTAFWRTPLQLALDARDKIRGHKSLFAPPPIGGGNTLVKQSFLASMKNRFVALNWFPDDKFWWIIPALIPGYRLIRQKRIPVIYATTPPASAALLGYLLSKLTGARLILDFRDPWVVAKEIFSAQDLWPLLGKIERHLEHTVLRHSHHVICTNDHFRRALAGHYRDLPGGKFSTVFNGYDADNLDSPKRQRNSKFTISYLGTFYLDRTPEPFFKTLSQLIQNGMIPASDIEIRLIGNVFHAGGKSVQEMIIKYRLVGQTSLLGFISHQEALAEMASADLLLLFAPNQPNQIPAKTFEYIGSKRPILAFAGEGATSDLIRSHFAGLTVPLDDEGRIELALQLFYNERNNPSRWYCGNNIHHLERKYLTGQLAALLDSTLSTPKINFP